MMIVSLSSLSVKGKGRPCLRSLLGVSASLYALKRNA